MQTQPNVVVFFTDQQRWDTLGVYGNPLELTPNLDRIASEGTILERCFTNQPVCTPARGCFQTGQYATTHGVWRNTSAQTPDLHLRTTPDLLAERFRSNGYEVGYIGKWHLGGTGDDPVPPDRRGGYSDHWEATDIIRFAAQPYQTRLWDADNRPIDAEDVYHSDFLTDRALRFIGRPRSKPFFLFVSYVPPHVGILLQLLQQGRRAHVAPDGYAERFAHNSYVPPDLAGLPGDWRTMLADYYGMVANLDECVGRLEEALKEQGVWDDTVFFFTSDHGCHFRTRNDEYKRSCHEASIRIPALLRGPGIPSGRVVRELVGLVDFAATLLDVCGIPVPAAMEGASFFPLMREERVDWRKEVFVQLSGAEIGRALRTDRWKYSVFAPDAGANARPASDRYVERYLYDLYADPHEKVNLIGRRDSREISDELRQRLSAYIENVEGKPVEIEPARFPA